MSNPEKVYYSVISDHAYQGSEPDFYEGNFEWKTMIELNSGKIIEEIQQFLQDEAYMKPYFNASMTREQGSWNTVAFKTWGLDYYKRQKMLPFTLGVFSQVPGLVSFSINQLLPNSEIKPHAGDTNANYRAHMGVIVDSVLPDLGIMVNESKRSWGKGEVLVFCDAHQHTAWNRSESGRVIILFDIIKPDYQNRVLWINASVLAGLSLQMAAQKMPFLAKLPRWLRMLIFGCCRVTIFVWLPVRNLFSRLFS